MLGVGVGVGFVSAAPGPAAVASGKIVFGWSSRSAGTVESGTLTYVVSGPMMDEKAGAAYKPTVFPAGYRPNADPLAPPVNVPAKLVGFVFTRTITQGCADGTTAVRTVSAKGIHDGRAVFTDTQTLVLNLRRGRGTATISPYGRDLWGGSAWVHNSTIWRPLGEVETKTTGDSCPETVGLLAPIIDLGVLLPRGARILWSSSEHLLKARIRSGGAVQLTGSSRDAWDLHHEDTSVHVDVNITIRGSLPAMAARCEWPTSDDLSRATTPQSALAIVRRAGLVTTYAGEHSVSSVPHGHFYIETASPYWPCGRPIPKLLYRS